MDKLYFGYCDTTINPNLPIGLEGYVHRLEQGFENSGVLDSLYARALSLKYGQEEIMIVSVDLCMLDFKICDAVRERVSEKLNIPKKNIMLSSTHTHSGPVTTLTEDFAKDEQISLMQKRINEYLENLSNKIMAICSEAHVSSHPALLYSTTFHACLGYNRRYSTNNDNGEPFAKMLFSRWEHPLHDTNGIVDQDIPVLMLERINDGKEDFYFNQNGTEKIVIINAPYHPVVMGDRSRYISADYPGAARECIEKTLGDGTKAIFLLGACGNTHPMLGCQKNENARKVIGKAIGYGIIAALAVREEIIVDSLGAKEEDLILENTKHGRIALQVLKIGNAAVAAVSAECFTELGIEVRKNSGFEQILISTITNGYCGYLPTREAFPEGGYEVDIALRDGYKEGILETIIQKLISMCKSL